MALADAEALYSDRHFRPENETLAEQNIKYVVILEHTADGCKNMGYLK
jgi:hypothetical protein